MTRNSSEDEGKRRVNEKLLMFTVSVTDTGRFRLAASLSFK
jgi:hypothetical protein